MPFLNRIELIGYVDREPESRFTKSGQQVVQFSLGVNRPKRTGEEKPQRDWFNVSVWGASPVGKAVAFDSAQWAMEHLKKGCLVRVEGRIELDKADKGYWVRIIADGGSRGVMLLKASDPAREEDRFGSPSEPPAPVNDDDIPF